MENTSIDDIIERIVKRLCDSDTKGTWQYVEDFCVSTSGEIDPSIVKQVYAKMRSHDICTENDSSNPRIDITATGINIYNAGGWKKYINDLSIADIKASKKEKKEAERSSITYWAGIIAVIVSSIGLFVTLYDKYSNKNKGIIISNKDSIVNIKKNVKPIEQKVSSKKNVPVQKHDSLGHTTK